MIAAGRDAGVVARVFAPERGHRVVDDRVGLEPDLVPVRVRRTWPRYEVKPGHSPDVEADVDVVGGGQGGGRDPEPDIDVLGADVGQVAAPVDRVDGAVLGADLGIVGSGRTTVPAVPVTFMSSFVQ